MEKANVLDAVLNKYWIQMFIIVFAVRYVSVTVVSMKRSMDHTPAPSAQIK